MSHTLFSEKDLAAVRARFKPVIKRAQVLRLIQCFGYPQWKARTLIEGASACLQPIPRRPGMPNEWARERVIEMLNPVI